MRDRVVLIGASALVVGLAHRFHDRGALVQVVVEDAHEVERMQSFLMRRGVQISVGLALPERARWVIEAGLEPEAKRQEILTQVLATTSADLILSHGARRVGDWGAGELALVVQGQFHVGPGMHLLDIAGPLDGARFEQVAAVAQVLGVVAVPTQGTDYASSRLWLRMLEASDTLLIEGTTPWEIDEAWRAAGFPLGPYEMEDELGLDQSYVARAQTRRAGRRYIPIADRMVQEGRLGRKVGVGWYRYPGGGGRVIDPLVEDLIVEEAWFAKVVRTPFSPSEIRQRIELALIHEAGACIDQGIVQNATMIDQIAVAGLGYCAELGGILHQADRHSPEEILAALEALRSRDPIVWPRSNWVHEIVAGGGRFVA